MVGVLEILKNTKKRQILEKMLSSYPTGQNFEGLKNNIRVDC